MILGVFIGFIGASNCISHTLLQEKTKKYRISGETLNMSQSCLTCRNEYFKLNGHLSNVKRVLWGVPQWSILWRCVFNIFRNNIIASSTTARFIIYADPTIAYFSPDNEEDNLNDIGNETLIIFQE